jgi:hypothetical protein
MPLHHEKCTCGHCRCAHRAGFEDCLAKGCACARYTWPGKGADLDPRHIRDALDWKKQAPRG